MTASSFHRQAGRDASAISELVETLREIHEKKALGVSGPSADGPAQASPSHRYLSLREELVRAEVRARRRDEEVERNLDKRPKENAAPYQETLFLKCQRKGRSAGRFRCENRLDRPSEVRVVKRGFTRAGAPLTSSPRLTVEPERFSLAPGASTLLGVEIDFAALDDAPAGVLETSLDLVVDDALALKLWIEVEIYDV